MGHDSIDTLAKAFYGRPGKGKASIRTRFHRQGWNTAAFALQYPYVLIPSNEHEPTGTKMTHHVYLDCPSSSF